MADKADQIMTLILSRRSELGLDDNEVEQLSLYLNAFRVFCDREAKYHSLWKQYGAIDSYHHITSKAARTQFYLEGIEDESDPIDLINYSAFLIRNMRAGRITNQVRTNHDYELLALALRVNDLCDKPGNELPDEVYNLAQAVKEKFKVG